MLLLSLRTFAEEFKSEPFYNFVSCNPTIRIYKHTHSRAQNCAAKGALNVRLGRGISGNKVGQV